MSTHYLTWREAFELFAVELHQFQMFRLAGLGVEAAGALLGVEPATAQAYENTIVRLMAALKSENEAAPGPARPEAAEQAHNESTEGASAP